ncbi:MAG: hypothetical protein HXX12_10335 [Geothrix sp.]|uniref:hypothetical protein n=1 Tax=Geothrix sp. TaxID=1962974 RepID=UPI0018302445|nr:hypothetical protein [Geothrix sp.]NWJ41357.1 hypothetical protein [Geothrix sp.]WIL20656.1 MAG: hypothetical protein QOZ81_003237 [Geothrix sp.]
MAISGIQSSSASLAVGPGKPRTLVSYDPRDTNQDGVVSPAELLAYDLKHPKVTTTGRKSAPLQDQLRSRPSDSLPNPIAQAGRPGSAYLDPKDADRNGTVSPLERQAYDLRHPLNGVSQGAAPATYAPGGSRAAEGADRSRVLDLYA